MKVDITQIIEKTLRDMIKGKWGNTLANIYQKYWNPANFVIIGLIGVLLNYFITNIFHDFFGNVLGIIAMLGWIWLMSVGPLGYIWGFGKKEKKDSKVDLQKPKLFTVEREVQDIEQEK